jgi:L-asparaginase
LTQAHHFLTTSASLPSSSNAGSTHTTSALDAATFAVTLFENNPLFNSGHGAVFTRDGINELEASVMVSRGMKKRGVGVMGLRHVKNPIKLAREMLLHGEQDLDGGNGEHRGPMMTKTTASTGAQGHCQLHKYSAEDLARKWGLEIVDPSYFFVQARWDEHMKGLKNESTQSGSACATWDAEEFFPQGTCGAVALDCEGVVACATSTGGMTNKLTGRIGDTPTLGAGFWAEEWEEEMETSRSLLDLFPENSPALVISDSLKGLLADCLPSPSLYSPVYQHSHSRRGSPKQQQSFRLVAMSGTGNGDSFLRTNAVRSASAIAQYKPRTSLRSAVAQVSGPGGDLQKSAGDRWRKTGEGEGGIIGIEFTAVRNEMGDVVKSTSEVVLDYNCGGMFRAYVDEHGKALVRIWKDGQHKGLEPYPWEAEEYDMEHLKVDKPEYRYQTSQVQ